MTGKASSEEDVVIDYLTAQNRPFNANDVFNNLHGQVGKTALTRVLAKLVEEGRIHGKCYGKQWVYVAKQDALEAATGEELQNMEVEISHLGEEIQRQQALARAYQSELGELQSIKSNDELRADISKMTPLIRQKMAELGKIRGGQAKVDKNEKIRVDSELQAVSKVLKLKRTKCKEILAELLDNIPKKKEDLLEEIGIELPEQ